MSYRWKPIEDYTSHAIRATQSLNSLAQVWREERELLGGQEAYHDFTEQLKREWAIETGLIEGLYTLHRGITQLLIEQGLLASLIPRDQVRSPDAVVAMMDDHLAAVNGLFDFVKGSRPLSTSYIKELHALITRHQETVEGLDQFGASARAKLIRGDYKKQPNNPLRKEGTMHEYCPPEQVSVEMDRLVALHHLHDDVAPEVEAAWLHHRFTQIHPFRDGNGRVARALASLVFIKAGWFPLVVRNQDRKAYIERLETADAGDLKPLVEYFARLQRKEFVHALSIARDVQSTRRVRDAIDSVRRQMQKRRDALITEWGSARKTAAALRDQAQDRFEEVADELTGTLHDVLKSGQYYADGAPDRGDRSYYYRYQIVETAKSLNYYANMQTYRGWSRLVLRTTTPTVLLVSFHGIGREFQGLLACSASWFQRIDTGEGEHTMSQTVPVTDEPFLISYKESLDSATSRFSTWLEDAIVRSLKLWQTTTL